MQPAVLRTLEFDRIREALASRALTALGRARALAVEPSGEVDDVRAQLALTGEAVTFTRQGGSLAITAPDDLPSILGQLDIDGQPLEPLALVGLAGLLRSVEAVATSAERSGGPALAEIARRAASFTIETQAVTRAIEPSGDVSDKASPALRDLRDALRRQRASLRASLDTLARGRDTAKYLQDQIVTDRNGRYVLVVRSEHRDDIPGLVHGSSASGASVYVEPLATIGLNNEIVSLVEREKAEVLRILSVLTAAFRARLEELDATLDVTAELDALYAKVDLARRMDGVAPTITDDGRVEFLGARHPLLIPAVRDLLDEGGTSRGPHPIASSLAIVPPMRALVISGPNTGGKTVALKAFGLLALMAQAGLFVPVEAGSAFTPFATVFADIGDAQSIAASLSTFSSHISRIVHVDRSLRLPALVLLDEVGSGTDPAEGGALGAAVIDHFRRRGALVVATTHDELLKSYAATTEGVATAGFGFHPETYAPTYKLIYGAPGRSLALEIAARLGLAPDVIADARRRRTGRESQLAAHLVRLDLELARLDHDRGALVADRRRLDDERAKVLEREARLTEREAVLQKRIDDRLHDKLRDARAEIDRVVGALKTKAAALAERADRRPTQPGPALSTGVIGGLRADARAALGDIGEALAPEGADAGGLTPLAEAPETGARVFVRSLGADGIVREVSGKQIAVDVRGMRLRTRLSDLAQPLARADAARATRASGASAINVDAAAPTPGATRDLVVVGSTVDAAIDRAEKFLDDALLADERCVRIVHGHGTGRLREALGTYLKQHPLVLRVSEAGEREGGRGATIVELKD